MALQDTLQEPVIKGNESFTWLTKGVLLATAVGAVGLYMMIPERKRKTVFK